MAGDYSRTQRVGDYLRREIAQLLQHEVRDPRIGMPSITGVEVSRDLAYAKVFVTLMGVDTEADAKEPLAALNRAAGFLRSRIARDATMRTTPNLRFYFDRSVGHGRYMEALIASAVSSSADESDGADGSDK